ncbi:RAD51-associated protein 1 isoform X1 [Oryzias melastigma]|uniref:RAD51 associated protein 1 n=1 Tax=Oryzias melastigma TaxID=30732 RepID=A0A3B3D2P6_ORYME|nr:RAD51-associated protein 1 isoform X1 [Oryzias melastigma]
MERPSRKAKVVNYCEAKDFEDDEDFASVKAPPHKKPKEEVKQQQQRKSSSQEIVSESSQKEKIRKPLDEKLYERDLEAAITLSLLNKTDRLKESSSKDEKIQTPIDENTDPASLHFSNCSVDGAVMGLDVISSEIRSSASKKTSSKTAEIIKIKDDDDDYQPKLTPDSESDEDFSEPAESEEEEFTVKKSKKKDKVSTKVRTKSAASSKKDKQPSKPSKMKPEAASKPVKSPPPSKPTPTRPPPSKPASSLSPAAGRVPKWNPPAQIGKSASSSHSPPVKSPSQGLRLGLSRLVRVKPLHPSVASH